MDIGKVYTHPTWWAYCLSIGFIVLGIYQLKRLKKSKNINESYNKNTNESTIENGLRYMAIIQALTALIGGIMFLIILIYQNCAGRVG